MSVQIVEFSSEVLGGPVEFSVICPKESDRRWPVLYLHHGLGDTHQTFGSYTDIDQYSSERGLIVVMPSASDSWFVNDIRPGGLAWEDHLVGELVEYVDSKFPTIPSREGRALSGFSMGGYGAVMYAFKHPGRFSAVSTHAASVMFGHQLRPDRPQRTEFMLAVAPPGGKYDLWELAEQLATDGPQISIRMDVGVNDHQLEYNRQFHSLLDDLQIVHDYEEVQGGHEWQYVNRQLPATLDFITNSLSCS